MEKQYDELIKQIIIDSINDRIQKYNENCSFIDKEIINLLVNTISSAFRPIDVVVPLNKRPNAYMFHKKIIDIINKINTKIKNMIIK